MTSQDKQEFLWGAKKKKGKKKKKNPGVQPQQITANYILKNRHLKLMNLSLFYVFPYIEMYEMQESGLIEIIPLICILAI